MQNNSLTKDNNILINDIQNLSDSSLNEVEYYSYNQFFKKFLEKYNLSFEQYELLRLGKNSENKEQARKEIETMHYIYVLGFKEYKQKYNFDFHIELEKQKRKKLQNH